MSRKSRMIIPRAPRRRCCQEPAADHSKLKELHVPDQPDEGDRINCWLVGGGLRRQTRRVKEAGAALRSPKSPLRGAIGGILLASRPNPRWRRRSRTRRDASELHRQRVGSGAGTRTSAHTLVGRGAPRGTCNGGRDSCAHVARIQRGKCYGQTHQMFQRLVRPAALLEGEVGELAG